MEKIDPNLIISYFTEYSNPLQKQYLALRRFFIDKYSAEQVAEEFNYSTMTVYSLVRDFKEKIVNCDDDPFFKEPKVCHNKRIHSHKVFKEAAKRGKSSTGWFYGFKLHLVINEKGELLSFCLTAGNTDDRKELYGKLFADKGYISQKLFEKLYSKSIHLVTKIKKSMKNKLMDISDKILLRKRAVIESVNDFLKNQCQIEHTRHRSLKNFVVNLIAGLAAYSFIPKKPSLKIKRNILPANIYL